MGFFQVLSTHLGTEMQYCAEEGPRAPAATRRQRCLPASGQLAVRKGRSGHTGKWQAQEPARKEEEEEKAAAIRTLLSEATEEQKQRLCRRGHSRPASRRWDWSPNRGALRSNHKKAGKDTAVAISIRANHYLCDRQPIRKSTL